MPFKISHALLIELPRFALDRDPLHVDLRAFHFAVDPLGRAQVLGHLACFRASRTASSLELTCVSPSASVHLAAL